MRDATNKLPREFYLGDTLTVSKNLLGKILCHETAEGLSAGKIVEVEAYIGPHDKAAHSYKPRSKRTGIQYGPGGYVYMFLIYGMYNCMNIVTGAEGNPEVVLIRALEPVVGLDIMMSRRGTDKVKNLCNGPGKLCKALSIDMSHYGIDLCGDELYLLDAPPVEPDSITATKRINIDYAEEAIDYPWRFIIKDSPYLLVKA